MKTSLFSILIIILLFVFPIINYAQEIEATLGGSTSSEGFSVIDISEGTTLFRVRGDGNVGIGTTSPSATLQVDGTTKIGTNTDVVAISDIIELTGTTANSNATAISYPSGWDKNNTRVLCCEIYYNNIYWIGLGYDWSAAPISFRYHQTSSNILLTYPNVSELYEKPYRLILMKVN